MTWAREFAAWIDASPEFERMAPTPFSTICFRAIPERLEDETLDSFNEALLEAVNETGEVFLSHTRLHNCFVLRLAIGNLKTRRDHLERTKELLVTNVRALSP